MISWRMCVPSRFDSSARHMPNTVRLHEHAIIECSQIAAGEEVFGGSCSEVTPGVTAGVGLKLFPAHAHRLKAKPHNTKQIERYYSDVCASQRHFDSCEFCCSLLG